MSETMGRCRSEVDDCYGSLPLVAIADAIDRLAEDVAAIKAKVGAVSPDDVRHFVESEKAWVTPPWQRAKWDEALAIICNGGDWGRGNNFDHGVLGALVIWADKEMDRLTAERDAAIRERDEARAEVERLKAELAARLADGNRQATLDSSPAAPPPAAPPPGWLTDDERELLQSRSRALRRWLVGRLPPPIEVTREVDLIDGILARAGSPPEQAAPWWLTEKERGALSRAFDLLCDDDGDSPLAGTVQALLARAGSPPVVVLPTVFQHSSLGDKLVALQQVKDAMDAAGVAWKVVGRE